MSLAHNWQVIRAALKADKERRRGSLRSREVDFLPAALEVIERPVSPTARVTTWVLLIGLLITCAWLVLGRVDVVVPASGKIVPTGNIKIVQSPGSGVVHAIYVRDGDVVAKGQAVAVVEAMKMQNELTAQVGGTVSAIHVEEKKNVEAGAKLVSLT